jgi:hypothetical protein
VVRVQITVIANCQARPVAEYVRLLGRDVEIVDILITHLAKDVDAARLEQAAAKSDFIFAQLVQPNYPVQFVRSAALKERYGDRVLLWPNLFFKGQTPDLCYVTAANGARVVGPLSEYHSRPVVDAWLAGSTVDQTEVLLTTGQIDTTGLRDLVAASLEELRRREQQCSVGVADVIAERWQSRRYFFTFNHPVSELMLKVAQGLLACTGQRTALSLHGSHVNEPLCQFVPPAWPAIVEELRLEFPTSTSSRGVSVDLSSGRVRPSPGAAYYTARELIETFFRCYDVQRSLLAGCRFT